MNIQKYQPPISTMKSLAGALALAMATTLFAPAISQAAVTAANATIRNVVKVEYSDQNGNGSFKASASVSSTVNLLAAAPTLTGPTPASGQSIVSGSAQNYDFVMYSNANGSDTYKLTVAAGTTASTASNINRYIVSTTDAQGAVTPTGNTTTTTIEPVIGASVILSDNDVDTVSVPAGSLNGISDNDYVIINGITYKVRATTGGTPQTHDTTNHVLTTGAPATIRLWLANGSTPADFSGVDLTGLTISQKYEVKIAAIGSQGDVYFNTKLEVKSDSSKSDSKNDTKTTFTAPSVTISKAVSSTTPKPGDYLEYTITVTGTETVKNVIVYDAVPKYTKLVSYDSPYSGGVAGNASYTAAKIFATVTKGATTIQATGDADTDGGAGNNVGYGKAPTGAAGDPLTFYLGTGSADGTGGTVANTESYVIKYTVQVL